MTKNRLGVSKIKGATLKGFEIDERTQVLIQFINHRKELCEIDMFLSDAICLSVYLNRAIDPQSRGSDYSESVNKRLFDVYPEVVKLIEEHLYSSIRKDLESS